MATADTGEPLSVFIVARAAGEVLQVVDRIVAKGCAEIGGVVVQQWYDCRRHARRTQCAFGNDERARAFAAWALDFGFEVEDWRTDLCR